MPFSKKWTTNKENIEKTVDLFWKEPHLTKAQMAARLNTTEHNVRKVLRDSIPSEALKKQKALVYSLSKTGDKNPMKSIRWEDHPMYRGECSDGKGYLTKIKNGKRSFHHRLVMAEALGLEKLPPNMDVHHIDGDKTNNSLDNLALCTKKGHHTIHSLQELTAREKYCMSTLGDFFQYMTSQ
mgnify:CR=1 FL=1